MPLIKSGSRAAISENIKEMQAAGHPHRVAVAAALSTGRKYGRYAQGGRVDHDRRPFVIPPDIPIALGRGNAALGGAFLRKHFRAEPRVNGTFSIRGDVVEHYRHGRHSGRQLIGEFIQWARQEHRRRMAR